jgi:hypothetical protein
MSLFTDSLAPKGDHVHILLKRRGRPVAAIYKSDEKEIRSPNIQKDKVNDAKSNRNP